MSVTIKLRQLRHSAKKLRPYARLIKGRRLEVAIDQTAIMTPMSAKYIHQGLLMAKAAAEQKEFRPEEMIVSNIMATEGPRVKRIRPNARGRANRYLKHLAHLVITVDQVKIETPKTISKPKKVTTDGPKS